MFENLNEVKRANASSSTKTRKAQFKVRFNKEKGTLVFSTEQFAEMNIADNSLSQFIDAANKRVFLAVMPGNSGTFAKTNKKGIKGKKFKNDKLIASLVENGYDFETIDLVKIGEEDDKTLYQITGNGALVMDVVGAVESESKVAAEMTQGQKDVASFENDTATPADAVNETIDAVQDEKIEDALAEKGELDF